MAKTTEAAFPLVDVTAENVDRTGFFCLQSRRKAEGYRRKLAWLKQRFDEGMRIRMLGGGGRGFIEYIPGEYAWRSVEATGFMLIHCIWVVGQSKGQGGGKQLLEACIEDARRAGMSGVAMVASERTWLVGKRFLLEQGFVPVDTAPPAFTLLTKGFGDATPPRFTGDWEDKASRLGAGLTLIRSDQCPYIEDAAALFHRCAKDHGIESREVTLKSAAEIRQMSPSAYGVFNAVLDGKLFSYHWLTERDFGKRLAERNPA